MRAVRRLWKFIFLVLIVGCLFGMAGLAWLVWRAGRPVALPTPNGPFAVGRQEFEWVDATRADPFAPIPATKRDLVVWIWYPTTQQRQATPAAYLPQAWARARERGIGPWLPLTQRIASIHPQSAEGVPAAAGQDRFPILIMAPGFGPLSTDYTVLAEALASAGYVVVSAVPTYSSSVVVFPDGRVAEQTPAGSFPGDDNAAVTPATVAADQAAGARLIAVWSSDVRFELDRLEQLDGSPGSFLNGRLDLNRVGVFGHSFGGATAWEACHLDTRCQAAANLDGWPYGDVVGTGLPQPFMYMRSEHSGGCDIGCQQSEHNLAAIFGAARAPSYDLEIAGTRHFNFSDYALQWAPIVKLQGLLGPIDGRRGLAISVAYLRAFFDTYLRDKPSPLLQGPSPAFPEVRWILHHGQ